MEATTGLAALTDFFDRYGSALITGDIPALASCYALPGTVVSDTYSFTFSSPAAVALSFLGASQEYDQRRLIAAHADIRDAQPLSDRLTMVTVTWEYLDAEGASVDGAPFRYMLRHGDRGPQICVVMPLH